MLVFFGWVDSKWLIYCALIQHYTQKCSRETELIQMIYCVSRQRENEVFHFLFEQNSTRIIKSYRIDISPPWMIQLFRHQ